MNWKAHLAGMTIVAAILFMYAVVLVQDHTIQQQRALINQFMQDKPCMHLGSK